MPRINKEFPYDATSRHEGWTIEIFDRNFLENTFMGERRKEGITKSAVWK